MPDPTQPPTTPEQGRAVVAERARARRARTRRLRRRVAAGATAAFLALFATISIQMATGNDPATGTASPKATARAPATTSGATTSSSTTDDASSSSSSSAPAAVTTQQS